MTRGARRALLPAVAGLAAAVALVVSPSSFGLTAWPSAGSHVYPGDGPVGADAPWHIDALDFFFEGMPPSNHTGVKPVILHNRSDHEVHVIEVFKLADPSATADQTVAALAEFGPAGLVTGGHATAEVGRLVADPGTTIDGAFDFAEPGGYAYFCSVGSHGGHWKYGMVGKILIAEPTPPAAATSS